MDYKAELERVPGLLDLEAVLSSMRRACQSEREHLLSFLDGLASIDAHASHLPLGYPNLFEFCRVEFGLSEGCIYRRIQVARQFRSYPALRQALQEYRLNLTQASLLCPLLGRLPVEQLIGLISGRSKREAFRILRDIIPDLPVLDKGASRDGLRYVGRGRSILRISLNEDQHRRLEKIRFDLAKNDRMQDWAGVFEQLLQELERANTQDKCLKVLPETVWQHYESDSRYIPRGLKVLILKKADNRCMFIGTNGRRCSQTRFLEIDHIRPLARGGLTRLDNLQVLCKSHNLFKGSSLQLPNLSP